MLGTAKSLLIGLALGCIASLPALTIAIKVAGGGHGSYLPAKLLFPYGMLVALRWNRITALSITLALAQLPLYGANIGAAGRGDARRNTLLTIVMTHVAVALVCILIATDAFASVS